MTITIEVSAGQKRRRIARLERRYAWLMERINKRSANEEAYDRDAAEAVALRWILDEYARLTSGER